MPFPFAHRPDVFVIMIVEAAQVQQAVDDVEGQLRLDVVAARVLSLMLRGWFRREWVGYSTFQLLSFFSPHSTSARTAALSRVSSNVTLGAAFATPRARLASSGI